LEADERAVSDAELRTARVTPRTSLSQAKVVALPTSLV